MLLSREAKQLLKNDLTAWRDGEGVQSYHVDGSVIALVLVAPKFSPDTVTLIDSQTHGRFSKAISLASATTIDWAQIFATLWPILLQIIPIIISLFTGQPFPVPANTQKKELLND